MLEIKFIAAELSHKEAAGIVALLTETHGHEIIPPSYARFGDVEVRYGPNAPAVPSEPKPAEATGPAPDGEPVNAPVNTPDDDRDEGGEEPTGDLDADGIPWDERIHSSSRKQNKDGTWARRRNTDDAVFAAVMAELKAGAQPAEDDTAATAFAPPPPLPAPAPEAPVVPAPPTPPQAPAAPTAAGGDVSFPAIMRTVTEMQRDGKIDKAGVDEVLGRMGVASIGLLVTASEDVRAGVAALLEARK